VNNKEPGKQKPTWQVRLDAIHLREHYGMTVGDIARVLSCDRRQIKYWLANYSSEIRQGDVY
jgi:transposase-like protein